MSIRESFLRSWKIKFTNQTPPELPCLDQISSDGNVDISAVEKSLQKCNESIANLNKQLQETEFVASYLWDLIHGVNKVKPIPSMNRSLPQRLDRLNCDLDNAIPLQGSAGSYESSPLDSTDQYVQAFNTFLSSDEHTSLSQLQSKFNSDGLKSSLPHLPNSCDSLVGDNDMCQRANSLDFDHIETKKERKPSSHYYSVVPQSIDVPRSYSPKPMRPIPAPRSSIMKSTVSSPSTDACESLPQKPQRTSSKPAPPIAALKPALSIDQATEGMKDQNSSFSLKKKTSATGDDKLDRPAKPVHPPAVPVKGKSMFSSWEKKKQRETDSVRVSMKETTDDKSKDEETSRNALPVVVIEETVNPAVAEDSTPPPSKASVSLAVNDPRRNHGYEEVILPAMRKSLEEVALPIVKKSSEDLACVSTDDDDEGEDEPLYFNIMLMQDRAINKMHTFYSKGQATNASSSNLFPKVPEKSCKHVADGNASSLPKERMGGGKETKGTYRRRWQPLKDSTLSSDSIRSEGSDSVFEEKMSFKNGRSILRSADSVDSQSDADDLSDTTTSVEVEDEKLQMRKWVVNSILESENSFLVILNILMKHMTTYKNVLNTPQVVISSVDIETIFHKIPEIFHAHKMFVYELAPKVEHWSSDQQIADIFKTLADEENKIAPEFIKNYPRAVQTIQRCWAENPTFADLSKVIKIPNSNESSSLEELLHKPVLRFQRNSLVLHDLIKCTPPTHSDYDTLQKTLLLSRLFLENLESPVDSNKAEHQRYLAKQGLIVEKVGNIRKLRHIFLFNDVLVCARQKITSTTKQKIHLEPKWYISMLDLSLDDICCTEEEKQLSESQQQEIESLQKRMSELQKELKSELKSSVREGNENQSRQWSFHLRSNKNLEKVKKKMVEQQAALIKASPCLVFKIHNRKFNKQHTLLMASDYERSNWRSTITGLLSRAQPSQSFSTAELQAMVNSQKISKAKMLGGLISFEDLSLDEEHLFGILDLKIFKLQGLKTTADYYCTVEVDTFNQFFLKAKTNVVKNSVEPAWNEEFEIELEGSQTLRILCYKIVNEVASLVGACALELSKAWLRGDFQEKPISINDELSVTISLIYRSRDQTIKRRKSSIKGGLFGAPIKSVAKREGSNIPLIVRTCIQEVEKRGMDEIGIYRISGISGDIQKLKKCFEKNSRVAGTLIADFDIHVVTGTLKSYFRELPEALFTDALYHQFVKGFGLADSEAKEACIVSLLESLPDPNKSTIEFLIEHLIKVSRHEQENRMTLQNLATVFGPTLLRPAVKEAQQQTLEELFSSGTREVMMQTSILFYFLTLREKNFTDC